MSDDATRQKIADWQQEPETRLLKLQYLKGRLTEAIVYWFNQMDLFESAIAEGKAVAIVWHKGKTDAALKEIRKLQGTIIAERDALNGIAPREGQITDDDIARARQYPFDELHPFGRKSGKVRFGLCPWHEQKTGSFALYDDNHVHCFSCGKSWDTIAFVQEKEGLSFIQAVRRLQ